MIERSGYKFLLLSLTLLIFSGICAPLFLPLFIVSTLFVAAFFRDPPRKIGEGVVSPADGKIDYIRGNRLEIFMSPFDCHINRAPVSGRIVKVRFREGSKPPAFIRRDNVRMNEILIESTEGIFKVVQIAGFLARRIVCYVKEGDYVEKGDKIGMIRFGSRVVIEVPENFKFVKVIGEKVKAGETIAFKDENP